MFLTDARLHMHAVSFGLAFSYVGERRNFDHRAKLSHTHSRTRFQSDKFIFVLFTTVQNETKYEVYVYALGALHHHVSGGGEVRVGDP